MNNISTYNESVVYWKQYQKFFPEEMQINENHLPVEEWLTWNNVHIHLDRMPVEHAKLKIVFIHGAGGNGRLLAPYARMLQKYGYEVVSPDLPPYGLSYMKSKSKSKKTLDYQLWIDILTEIIDREMNRDGKPIILLGSSIGGMLAYHTAVQSKRVKGLIATTFVDTSKSEVRDQLAPNKLISRLGKFFMDKFPLFLDPLPISVNHVSRMQLITNNVEMTKLIIKDTHAAGTKIPLRLLRTFLNMQPVIKPENFDVCPVLLVHPEIDPMTPYRFSKPFFDHIKGKKEIVILEGAGHFPIEQPGLGQMNAAVLSFLKEVENELSDTKWRDIR
ncbi:esterase [Paenibacillus baekrokdamisoli]|uniref:Esterase n=1 Tax=Paenibacillus baekrokdamisoli TaxID=1712516 RepID=A0A3G9JGY8_9BACL|nr:alpha/beta hydrolase [Paenibacillus baekrokdamisoli]MBB3072574.1 alpha-beta hydrolase superfamily lysophospholipase [Paenibacillus baekrokdamisoli]BBH22374.1 esterase [Paenibacillus baekrokdamisoli]